MLSTNRLKLIRSLRQKKYRDQLKLFIVEGEKMIGELLDRPGSGGYRVRQLFATNSWIENHRSVLRNAAFEVNEVTRAELKKISNLVSPQPAVALVSIPDRTIQMETLLQNPVLAFDSIRDPGNLGTIIRTADWFGFHHIVCSEDSADLYNPKVIQATMGSFTRVIAYYTDIRLFLSQPGMKEKAVYGTFLEGENLYNFTMEKNPLILFGNESHGLSDRFEPFIRRKIAIPSYPAGIKGSESLNVAASVAVICAEMRRPA